MFANYHTHTTRCQHADGEDRAYIEAAIEAGYKVIGISDHCPWVFPDNYVSHIRMTPTQIDGYVDSFQRLREEYKKDIQILIGFESEYIPALMDAQEELLASYPIDYQILGQHFLDREDESLYAGRATTNEYMISHYVDLCLEGMRTGKYQYLAHPDLIHYVGSNSVYEKHMRRLCEGIRHMNGILEVNVLGIAGNRNYPNERFWRIAKETGNKVIIGVDAHSPEQLLPSPFLECALRLCEGMERVEQLQIK